MEVLTEGLQKLFALLLPHLRHHIEKNKAKTLPWMILVYGIYFFLLGLLGLVGFAALYSQPFSARFWLRIFVLYIVIGLSSVVVAYLLALLFEPYLFYFVALPLWATLHYLQRRSVWLEKFYHVLTKGVDTRRLEIIWRSIPRNTPEEFIGNKKQSLTWIEVNLLPLIVRAEDLQWKFLKKGHQVFSILLMPFNGESIKVKPPEDPDAKYWVDVSLHSADLGIYNNFGKKWLNFLLEEKAKREKVVETLLTLDHQVHKYLTGRSDTPPRISDIGHRLPPQIYLRWASGGAMLISRYESASKGNIDNYWVALFFRDIFPIGWNVGNGASETSVEHASIQQVCARELCEEYVVLNSHLEPDKGEVKWYPFEARGASSAIEEIHALVSPRFQYKHVKYREYVDKVKLVPTADDIKKHEDRVCHYSGRQCVGIEPVKTGLAVKVFNGNSSRGLHLLFSINPFEQGIETIALMFIQMRPGWSLIDGEFHLGREVLIRRPVALFNLGWLHRVFSNKHGALGEFVLEGDSAGGKILPPIPADKFRLFLDDMWLRQRRLKTLLLHNQRRLGVAMLFLKLCEGGFLTDNGMLSQDEIENAISDLKAHRRQLRDPSGVVKHWEDVFFEIKLHAEWLLKYGKIFAMHGERKRDFIENLELRAFCPVTWKSLEYIFANEEVLDEIKRL